MKVFRLSLCVLCIVVIAFSVFCATEERECEGEGIYEEYNKVFTYWAEANIGVALR